MNLFKSKKLLVVNSSLRWASQDGWSVSISSFNSDFCSGVRLATHFSVSNLMGAEAGAAVPLAMVADGAVFGAPKKDVRVASFLGFFWSFEVPESGPAFLFRLAMERVAERSEQRR